MATHPAGPLALQFNPAGLAAQRGLVVGIDGRSAWQHLTYTAPGAAPVANGAAPEYAPNLVYVGYGWGPVGVLQALTVGIGVTTPSAISKLSYPADGAQRYQIIASHFTILYGSAAVAAQLTGWLEIGVTLQLIQANASFSQAVRSNTGHDPGRDAVATMRANNALGVTGVLGVSIAPGGPWSLGVSYRPRYRLHGKGTLEVDFPPSAAALEISQHGEDATLRLAFADVVRLGGQFVPLPRLLLEANLVYEAWSVLENLVVVPHDISITAAAQGITQSLPPIVIPQRFKDAGSLRLGAEVIVVPEHLTARMGYAFETSAIPLAQTSVAFPNYTRHVLGVGCTWRQAWLALDVGYAHHFEFTQSVAQSAVVQTTAPSLLAGVPNAQAEVVGNGTYAAGLDVLAVALTYYH